VSENDNERGDRKRAEQPKPAVAPAVVLDEHRGMTAQKETDARREQSDVQADQQARRQDQVSLEKFLFSGSAMSWPEAAEKIAYLLRLFAATGEAQDPRYKQLIEDTLSDIERLSRGTTTPAS
jgi:hypothetical protein